MRRLSGGGPDSGLKPRVRRAEPWDQKPLRDACDPGDWLGSVRALSLRINHLRSDAQRVWEHRPNQRGSEAGAEIPSCRRRSFDRGTMTYASSPGTGATFGARRRYRSRSCGFALPARSRRNASAVRRAPTFSATAAAMN